MSRLLRRPGERFHRTVLDEFYRVAFRKKIYRTIDELQNDLERARNPHLVGPEDLTYSCISITSCQINVQSI